MRKVRYPLLMKACKQGLVQGVGLNDPLPTFRTDLGGGILNCITTLVPLPQYAFRLCQQWCNILSELRPFYHKKTQPRCRVVEKATSAYFLIFSHIFNIQSIKVSAEWS